MKAIILLFAIIGNAILCSSCFFGCLPTNPLKPNLLKCPSPSPPPPPPSC